MGFNYYHSYYGYPIGVQIRGQIGKKFIYQRIQNVQIKYPYKKPTNPRTTLQQAHRARIRQAVWAWQDLTQIQKNFYRQKEPIRPIMSGYNYFISQYILQLLKEVVEVPTRTIYKVDDWQQYTLDPGVEQSIWIKSEQGNLRSFIVNTDSDVVFFRVYLDDELVCYLNEKTIYDISKLNLGTNDGIHIQVITHDAGTPRYTFRLTFDTSRYNTKLEVKLHNATVAQITPFLSFFCVRDKIL